MIAKYMDSPQTLQQCKHKVMLEDIVVQLLARARKGLQTRILKVKSHIGIQGTRRLINWPQPDMNILTRFDNPVGHVASVGGMKHMVGFPIAMFEHVQDFAESLSQGIALVVSTRNYWKLYGTNLSTKSSRGWTMSMQTLGPCMCQYMDMLCEVDALSTHTLVFHGPGRNPDRDFVCFIGCR